MRTAFILLVLVLSGCGSHRGQWVLQSFDKDNGYVFTKDGTQYHVTCVATGHPVLGAPPNEVPDTNPDALPPEPADNQTSCSDILAYLHKPVPNLKQVYGSILLFTGEKNYKLEFEIKHAK